MYAYTGMPRAVHWCMSAHSTRRSSWHSSWRSYRHSSRRTTKLCTDRINTVTVTVTVSIFICSGLNALAKSTTTATIGDSGNLPTTYISVFVLTYISVSILTYISTFILTYISTSIERFHAPITGVPLGFYRNFNYLRSVWYRGLSRGLPCPYKVSLCPNARASYSVALSYTWLTYRRNMPYRFLCVVVIVTLTSVTQSFFFGN